LVWGNAAAEEDDPRLLLCLRHHHTEQLERLARLHEAHLPLAGEYGRIAEAAHPPIPSMPNGRLERVLAKSDRANASSRADIHEY
jgi:hypothetical protein